MSERTYDRLLVLLGALAFAVVGYLQFAQVRLIPVPASDVVPAVTELAPAWPTAIGSPTATHVVDVTILAAVVAPGHRARADVVDPAAEARMLHALEVAAELIDRWSDGTVSVRFEIHRATTPVRLVRARGDATWRWPEPRGIRPEHPEAAMVLALWSDVRGISGASLAGDRSFDGRLIPYLSVPIGEATRWQHAEAIVHEICHGLESLALAAGAPRVPLHDAARYGFAADAAGSWAEWYAFYLTHPTAEALKAAALPRPGREPGH